MWILYHLLKRAASPVPIEAFANDGVIVKLVVRKERLGDAPWTLGSGQLLCIEGTSRLGLKADTIVVCEASIAHKNRLCDIDELWELAVSCQLCRLFFIR